jgi:hypothetical protein
MAHIKNKCINKMFMHSGLRKSCCKPEVLSKAHLKGTKVFMGDKFPVSECRALLNQQTAVINIYK